MNFIVAAVNGTHIYQVEPKSPPKLLQTLPRAQPGNPECLVPHSSGLLATLQPNGVVCIWDGSAVASGAKVPPCEVLGQGPIARCYFSSLGSFLVTWEHMTSLRLEGRGAPNGTNGAANGKAAKGGPVAFGRAENLCVWQLTRRPAEPKELEVKIIKDGSLKLGINVDHLDGKSGLLVRRVDPEGLVYQHNLQVLKTQPELLVLPGDQVLAVNEVKTSEAQALAAEIQRAQTLLLRLKRGSGWLFAHALARFFAPHISPLRWPPIQWTSNESHALKFVTDEVLVLSGCRPSQVLGRIAVQHLSQLMISPSFKAPEGGSEYSCYFATFSPTGSGCGPAMVRVFHDCAPKNARPVLTKGLFSSAAWVTMKWEPSEGKDLLLLVHSSDLTEEDLACRTLHGHGANGLYLLRTCDREPVTVLTTSEEVLLDVAWCHGATSRGAVRRIVTLLGPQPATVALVLYAPGKPIQRVSLDSCMHGVRNSICCDNFGRSLCIHVQSERGMGLSNEADSADIFDLRPDAPEAVAQRCAVQVPHREREHVGPSVSSVLFSPDGRVLLANVQIEMSSELRCISAADGRQLFSVRFDGICNAMWLPSSSTFEPPAFEKPSDAATAAAARTVAVELRDREWLQRRWRQLESAGNEMNGEAAAVKAQLAQLEEMLALPEDQLIFEFTSSEGSTLMPTPQEALLSGGYRDVAMAYCRLQRLPPARAEPLGERLEFLTRRMPKASEANAKAKAKVKAGTVRRRPPVDPQDADALRRRVRALQKKLREIEKLKAAPSDAALDVLQREKISGEAELRVELQQSERQLQLLERPPRMIFDVETEGHGSQEIHYYDGDDCMELAKTFCQKYGLERGLADLLASNMQERLMQGA